MDLFNSILNGLSVELRKKFKKDISMDRDTKPFSGALFIFPKTIIDILSIDLMVSAYKHDGEVKLNIGLETELQPDIIVWDTNLKEVSNKLFDISKKYDLSYYNGQNIHLANPLKSLKFKPTKSNMEDIVFFMDVARLGYTPLRILDSKKQTGVSFVGTCNITNATLQEITEGVAKEIWNFYNGICNILTNQKFILNELAGQLKYQLIHKNK